MVYWHNAIKDPPEASYSVIIWDGEQVTAGFYNPDSKQWYEYSMGYNGDSAPINAVNWMHFPEGPK